MSPRSYIETTDRPTVLYILYTMVSLQQMKLQPESASQNDDIFAQSLFTLMQDHLAMVKFQMVVQAPYSVQLYIIYIAKWWLVVIYIEDLCCAHAIGCLLKHATPLEKHSELIYIIIPRCTQLSCYAHWHLAICKRQVFTTSYSE